MPDPSPTPADDLLLLRRDDPGFEEATHVWNARFESRPEVVARPRSEEEVVQALGLARAEGWPLTVKSGGHDYAGKSAAEGGLLLDLSAMAAVELDPGARRARVGPGARWADVDRAAAAHGLATPGGTVSTVGVAGFTLGGGQGWLTRKHGLACDNLLGARVVTADGRVARASEEENPELFWGLRGGGANLGVVTSLELALHPLPDPVLAGQVLYPLDRAAEVLRFFARTFGDAPDELMCYPFFYRVPPMDAFPEGIHGDVVLALVVCYAGPVAEGEPVLAPFREQPGVLLDAVLPQSYVELQTAFDAGMGPGNRWYSRAHYLDALEDGCLEALLGALDPFPGAFTTVYLGAEGGAAGRVPTDATAFPHRDASFSLHIFPGWADPAEDEAVMGWARELWEAVEPWATGGVYVNLLGEDEEDRVPRAYEENYARLAEVKAEWDPGNLFRRNQNVPPAGG